MPDRAAFVAAIVYISTPWIYRLAAIPYVEGPLCYFHAALIWAIVRAWTESDRFRTARLWGMAGLLAGGAFTCKYPGLISAIAPAGLAAGLAGVSRKSGRIAAFFVAGAVIAVGPWLSKNAVNTGNPVYPLAYRVFGGRFWDEELDAKWSRAWPATDFRECLDRFGARCRRAERLAVPFVRDARAARRIAARVAQGDTCSLVLCFLHFLDMVDVDASA